MRSAFTINKKLKPTIRVPDLRDKLHLRGLLRILLGEVEDRLEETALAEKNGDSGIDKL